MFDYDSNAILTEYLPSILGACIKKGVQNLLYTLTTAGHIPTSKSWTMKLVISPRIPLPKKYPLPSCYPAYSSPECFWKIPGLCSTDSKYPAQEWDYLLLQVTMTLNLLRTSCTKAITLCLRGHLWHTRLQLVPFTTPQYQINCA